MKKVIQRKIPLILMILMVSASNILAARREISFPITNGLIFARPLDLAFSRSGQIGFVLVLDTDDFSTHLFSFSTEENKVLDHYDLSQDFGANLRFLLSIKKHRDTNTFLAYGLDINSNQKVVMFTANETGRLLKLWVVTFPSGFWRPDVVFNRDGSKVYVLYQQDRIPTEEEPATASTHIALLNSIDGSIEAAPNLSNTGPVPNLAFNQARNQAIAVFGGRAYILSPEPNSLTLESIIDPPRQSSQNGQIEVSKDGRFVITYAGYPAFQAVPTPELRSNIFYSYDLDLKTSRMLAIKGDYTPVAENIAFHSATGDLFAPYNTEIRGTPDGGFTVFPNSGSRLANKLTLADDGALVRGNDLKLPKRSAGSDSLNLIKGFNTIAFSESGEMGFISTSNGRLFTFDTSTSEVLNDQLLDANGLLSIQLLEGRDLLAFGNGTNKLSFVDISTGPVVESLSIKGNRATIKGANFLSGARVEVDGEEVEGARRNAANPGREIDIPLRKADYPRGREFTLVVINRDGGRSQPQTFKR